MTAAITWADLARLKKAAKAAKATHPHLSHVQRLDALAAAEYGVRHFHELQKRYEAHIDTYIDKDGRAYHCRFCDFTFDGGLPKDIKDHGERHQHFEEARATLGFLPAQYREREHTKRLGYDWMHAPGAVTQRDGALAVLLAGTWSLTRDRIAQSERQARLLGDRLRDLPITRAVASPLSRARRTAELALGEERAGLLKLDRDLQETWAIHGVYPAISWTPDNRSIVFWADGRIQRVDVGTQANATSTSAAIAPVHDAHHAGGAHAAVDGDAPVGQLLSDHIGRAHFLEAQLGVGVDVFANGRDAGRVGEDGVDDFHGYSLATLGWACQHPCAHGGQVGQAPRAGFGPQWV